MKTLLEILRPYGLNERALTEADFLAICEAEQIEVVWSNARFSFYFAVLGERCIVLPKRLKGLRLLFAAYHELAHAMLSPGHVFDVQWHGMRDGRDEAECDAVALVALIPKHLICELAAEFGETRYGNKLWQDRCRLFFIYGI